MGKTRYVIQQQSGSECQIGLTGARSKELTQQLKLLCAVEHMLLLTPCSWYY